MAILYDSVRVGSIPANATLIAAYVNGLYANVEQMKVRFPNARIVTITINAWTMAEVLDVETSDATPDEVPIWCERMARWSGIRPTVYVNRSTWPEVVKAVAAANILAPDYWIADATGTAHLLPGSVATQWGQLDTGSGLYDVSLTDGIWPDRAPPAPPPPTKGLFMPWIATNASGTGYLIWPNGTKTGIPDAATAGALEGRFGASIPVSDAWLASVPLKA